MKQFVESQISEEIFINVLSEYTIHVAKSVLVQPIKFHILIGYCKTSIFHSSQLENKFNLSILPEFFKNEKYRNWRCVPASRRISSTDIFVASIRFAFPHISFDWKSSDFSFTEWVQNLLSYKNYDSFLRNNFSQVFFPRILMTWVCRFTVCMCVCESCFR